MTDQTVSEAPSWTREWRRTFSDLVELFTLRQQLAEFEVRNDLRQLKRLVVTGSLGLLQCTTGMAVLVVLLGHRFDSWLASSASPADPVWGSLSLGLVLVLCGAATAYRGWHRFQHDFSGLQDSIAEFREDAAWLREWSLPDPATAQTED